MKPQGRNISISSDDCQSATDISPKRRLKLQTSRQFDDCQEASLSDLSVEQLKDLVSSMEYTLGSAKVESYESILQEECIDGSCFSQLGNDELADIGFDPDLKILCQQHLQVPPSPQGAASYSPTSDRSVADRRGTFDSSHGVLAFKPISPSSATKAAPASPSHTYGQLVVLGFREHRLTNEQVIYPVGTSNDVFPLKRQEKSTGVKVASSHVYLRPEQIEKENDHNDQVKEVKCLQIYPSCEERPEPDQASHSLSTADSTHRMVLEPSIELITPRTSRRANASSGEALLPYKVEVEYTSDPAFDMFQVGRHDGTVSKAPSSPPSISPRRVNDVVVKGLVLNAQGGRGGAGTTHRGAISRVACRLLCERATGRTYLFAGGFNSSKTLSLSDTAPQWVHTKTRAVRTASLANNARTEKKNSSIRSSRQAPDGLNSMGSSQRSRRRTSLDSNTMEGDFEFDALTNQGIKVFFPVVDAWREISVMGRVYTLRAEGSVCGVLTSESNELYTGCIIDIGGGVCLTFTADDRQRQQQPHLPPDSSSMMDVDPQPAPPSPTTRDPNHFLTRLNDCKPICPVLMNTLHFPLRLPPQRQAVARLQSLRAAGQDSGFVACQHPSSTAPGMQLPMGNTLTIDGVDRDQQPYVFTACGHCFGFNAAFSGKACPLCRQMGPYVPLLFPFAKEICAEQPTHVFHPCGHAASLQTCLRWSQIPLPDSASVHEYLHPPHSRRGGAVGGRRPPVSRQRSTGSAGIDAGSRSRGVAMGVVEAGRSSTSAVAMQYSSLCLPQHPACPFCSKKLELTAAGGQCFSKLVVQFEKGDVTLADI